MSVMSSYLSINDEKLDSVWELLDSASPSCPPSALTDNFALSWDLSELVEGFWLMYDRYFVFKWLNASGPSISICFQKNRQEGVARSWKRSSLSIHEEGFGCY